MLEKTSISYYSSSFYNSSTRYLYIYSKVFTTTQQVLFFPKLEAFYVENCDRTFESKYRSINNIKYEHFQIKLIKSILVFRVLEY